MDGTFVSPPRNDGKNHRERWWDCTICGMTWPESTMTRQKGKRYCPNCYDPPPPTHYPIRHEKR